MVLVKEQFKENLFTKGLGTSVGIIKTQGLVK